MTSHEETGTDSPGKEPCATDPAAAQLLAHPNWFKLSRVRQEIAMLIALNEFDSETGIFCAKSNVELAVTYREYTRDQFKHTFAALRRYGIAKPRERFVDCKHGRRQIGTEYRLATGTKAFRDQRRVERQRRIKTDRERRRHSGVSVGKLPFSRREQTEIERLIRNRRPLPTE